MKKGNLPLFVIATISVIMLGVGVYYWYMGSGAKTVSPQKALTELKETLEEDFSEPEESVFSWYVLPGVEGEETIMVDDEEVDFESVVGVDVSGWGMIATDVLSESESYELIDLYFKDNGFTVDQYNIGSGTLIGYDGYKNGSTVCLVNKYVNLEEAEDSEVDFNLESSTSTIEIYCGLL